MSKILRPAPLSRRLFLQRSALLAAGAALPSSLLAACGDSSSSSSAPLVVDPNVPFWLQGNFGPVHDEVTAFDLPVRGRIPSELNGLYVRNGSNPQNTDSPHWFSASPHESVTAPPQSVTHSAEQSTLAEAMQF